MLHYTEGYRDEVAELGQRQRETEKKLNTDWKPLVSVLNRPGPLDDLRRPSLRARRVLSTVSLLPPP
jgi:uncharacterized protein YegL